MPMVTFMPWCRIDKAYALGEIEVVPFERHGPIEGLDDAAQCRVNVVLGSYKSIEGKPVDQAALVRIGGRSFTEDLSEVLRERILELVGAFCFAGLAKREYFNAAGHYCNSDCFAVYAQKFDKADFTAIVTRRREGHTTSGWPIDEIAISMPVHCQAIGRVSVDDGLLQALVEHRGSPEWGRWQSAITCFNQANTDSENIRYQVEWVLLASAFEHVLGAKSDAKDVASKFVKRFVPTESVLASAATRRSERWGDNEQPLRYEWMREFYRIRGDFAHGKLGTEQPMVWEPLEHLVLATTAFPLVVKRLLEAAGRYELTVEDRVQIDCFEKFADTPRFLGRPPNQKNSLDSYWKRCRDVESSRITLGRAFENARKTSEAKGLKLDELGDDVSTDDETAGGEG